MPSRILLPADQEERRPNWSRPGFAGEVLVADIDIDAMLRADKHHFGPVEIGHPDVQQRRSVSHRRTACLYTPGERFVELHLRRRKSAREL